MDIEMTRNYYANLDTSELCQCAYCLNYIKEVKSAYPALANDLKNIGVNIKKPFETMPLEPDEKGNIKYAGVQYIVFGDKKCFGEKEVSCIGIRVTDSHPSTGIIEEHFVIETDSMVLKCTI